MTPMVDSNKKGAKRERQLRNFYREMNGHEPIRIPASGSGTTMDLPDLLVGRLGLSPLAIELKTGADDILYVQESESRALRRFCRAFGAKPRLCGRWDGNTDFFLMHPDDVPRTDGGNYRLRKEVFEAEAAEVVTRPS